jgi:hypothetical protein
MWRGLSLPATFVLALACVFAATSVSWMAAARAADKPPSKAELEKQFTESMSGVTLSGHYIIGKYESGKELSEDHYEIAKVIKLKGDTWLFDARIQVEGHDLTLPVPLKVLWAGETPVVTLDDVTIPGLGTFSVRLLIDGHYYAGTWRHGDDGGQMFGTIEKTESKDKQQK